MLGQYEKEENNMKRGKEEISGKNTDRKRGILRIKAQSNSKKRQVGFPHPVKGEKNYSRPPTERSGCHPQDIALPSLWGENPSV